MAKVLVLHGGELASDIAERIAKDAAAHSVTMQVASMENFKEFKLDSSETVQTVIFVVQTIENEAAPEAAGSCCRFFKRKTHAADLLAGKLRFAVLALGDSNLLLDRQTTTAKDCNQVGQTLDARLAELGDARLELRVRRHGPGQVRGTVIRSAHFSSRRENGRGNEENPEKDARGSHLRDAHPRRARRLARQRVQQFE